MRIWKFKNLSEMLEQLSNEDQNIPQEQDENQEEEQNEDTNDLELDQSNEQEDNQEMESNPTDQESEVDKDKSNEESGNDEKNLNEESNMEEEKSNEESGEGNDSSEGEKEESGESLEDNNPTGDEENTQEENLSDSNLLDENNKQEEPGEIDEQKEESKNDNQELNDSKNLDNTSTTQEESTKNGNSSLNDQSLEEVSKSESQMNETSEEENTQEDCNEVDEKELQKELLQKLRDKLEEYKNKREEQEKAQEEKNEEKVDEIKNEFLESLKDLPSFEERSKGASYSINTEDPREVSEVIIKTLVNKFLNQRFKKNKTDLNVRSNSLEKTNGFYKWEIKDVITHLETEQYTKVLTDKYGYDYANGKDENVPLSFYFDLSGSMSSYSSFLAVIAIELLKKNVKVLVGFNEELHLQIDSIDKAISVSELVEVLETAGASGFNRFPERMEKYNKVNYKVLLKNIDDYLIEKKAEKVVVFSDFDSVEEVVNLSHHADVYYLCFEGNIDRYYLRNFEGFLYPVQDEIDLEKALVKVNEKRFKSLVYLDNPESIRRR